MNFFLRYKYVLAAVLALGQIGVLAYMIEGRAHILRNGREITLLTEPVDPRDLLRGDYVILGYAISRVANTEITGEKPKTSGTANVYVALIKGVGADWVRTRASWQPFNDLKAVEITIVGKTPNYYSPNQETISLTYGIERYYVPEGQGKTIEQGQVEKAVQVTLSVAKNGQAQIKSLSLEGKTLYAEPLY